MIQRRPGPMLRLLFAVPVMGWMLRDLAEGGADAIGWFALTVVCALGIAVLLFGLAGLVIGMLVMAAFSLTMIILVTRG